PRLSGRGERPGPGPRGRPEAAFNAATAFGPWRTEPCGGCRGRVRRLQCGHGFRAVENDGHRRAGDLVCRPSMRPRLSGRGEPGSGLAAGEPLNSLQCGHGFRAVENDRRGVLDGAAIRAFNAATAFGPWRTSTRSTTGPSGSTFNAA